MSPNEFINALATALMTVLTGALVFSISQLISKFLIEPYNELKQAKADVISALYKYDSVVPSAWDIEFEVGDVDKERLIEAKKILWEKGSHLISAAYSVPLYGFFYSLSNIPKRSDLVLSGLLLLEIADALGKAHYPEKMDELSKNKNLIVKKLGIDYSNLE